MLYYKRMNKKFTIIHDDETMTVSLDGEFVCEFNHDGLAWNIKRV